MYIRSGRIDSVLKTNNYWWVSNIAKPLIYGDTINSLNAKWDSTTLFLADNSFSYGFHKNILDWATGRDLFIGVKYQTSLDTIYGWVRVNIPFVNNFVKNCYIKDYSTTGFVNSVNEIDSKNNNVVVFPNPTSAVLNFLNINYEFDGSEIEILNSIGQIVHQQKFIKDIDVSKLTVGIYTIKMSTPKNGVYCSKFVKSNL